ncbi:MAG: hypothetical protein ACLT5P_08510 [Flavonifractor plautii]
MKASTAPTAAIPEHGYPMHMCEILNQLTAPAYPVRTSCNTPPTSTRPSRPFRRPSRTS